MPRWNILPNERKFLGGRFDGSQVILSIGSAYQSHLEKNESEAGRNFHGKRLLHGGGSQPDNNAYPMDPTEPVPINTQLKAAIHFSKREVWICFFQEI